MTLQHTKPKATRVVRTEPATESRDDRRRRHWLWLLAGFPFAFAVPFLLADTLELNRDLSTASMRSQSRASSQPGLGTPASTGWTCSGTGAGVSRSAQSVRPHWPSTSFA